MQVAFGAFDLQGRENVKQKKVDANEFIRLLRNESGRALGLQTAITTDKPRTGFNDLRVDLIGAVHVGDKTYYQPLNKQFATYDAVLYESDPF